MYASEFIEILEEIDLLYLHMDIAGSNLQLHTI